MTRWFAGIAAVLLIVAGAFFALQGQAAESSMPPAPTPRYAAIPGPTTLSPIGAAPEADPKSKEEKRFARADKDENGRITLAELVEPRRAAFARLTHAQAHALARRVDPNDPRLYQIALLHDIARVLNPTIAHL